MKRKILVIAVMSLMLGACSSNAQTTDNIAQDNGENISVETDEDLQENVEISLETLKNAKESDKEDFVYEEFEGQVWIGQYIGDSEIVVIPDEIEGSPVIEISRTAFRNNETVKAVKIGNNVKIIRDQAFVNCISLKYVIFGDSVEIVEKDCFIGCYDLEEVLLNDGLVVIEETAFPDIVNSLIIPRSVTEIGSGALGINTPVEVYAGSPAEKLVEEYAQKYTGFTYEVIE